MKTFALTVAQPCHESWEGMTPEEKGRFCSACKKTVVDFSAMSDRQLADYFSGSRGRLCGRFHTDQLNRQMAAPPKPVPWMRPLVPLAFSALTLLLEACSPQNEIKGEVAVAENVVTNASEIEPEKIFVSEQSKTHPADTTKPVEKEITIQVVTEKKKKRHPSFNPVDTMRLPARDTITKPVDQIDTTHQQLLQPRKETFLMGMVSYAHYKAMEEKKKKELAKKEAQQKAGNKIL